MECAQTGTTGLLLVFRTIPDAVVSTIKFEQYSEPEPEDAMHVDDMDTIEMQPSISLSGLCTIFQRQSSDKAVEEATGIGVLLCLWASEDTEEERNTDRKRLRCHRSHFPSVHLYYQQKDHGGIHHIGYCNGFCPQHVR